MKRLCKAALLATICTSCTPAEIAIAEELTEEAIIVEKDLFDPKPVEQPCPTLPECPSDATKVQNHRQYPDRRPNRIRGDYGV